MRRSAVCDSIADPSVLRCTAPLLGAIVVRIGREVLERCIIVFVKASRQARVTAEEGRSRHKQAQAPARMPLLFIIFGMHRVLLGGRGPKSLGPRHVTQSTCQRATLLNWLAPCSDWSQLLQRIRFRFVLQTVLHSQTVCS